MKYAKNIMAAIKNAISRVHFSHENSEQLSDEKGVVLIGIGLEEMIAVADESLTLCVVSERIMMACRTAVWHAPAVSASSPVGSRN